MGTFALINAIGCLVGGGLLTIWAQSIKDRAEREKLALESALQRHQASDGSQTAARKFKGDKDTLAAVPSL